MDADDIKRMFAGISDDTKNIIARKLSTKLAKAIIAVNKDLEQNGQTKDMLRPRVDMIFHAFRLCPIDNHLKVVVYDYTTEAYNHAVAKQGVLWLNTALTTRVGATDSHACWREYTDGILSELTLLPQRLIFIVPAGTTGLIDPRHVILRGDPHNYYTLFQRANDILVSEGKQPIVWVPPNKNTTDTLYIFSDGGSTGNGRARCRASWAYYITDKNNTRSSSGPVTPVNIPGKPYKSSNQRGELTGMIYALEYVWDHLDDFTFKRILVVSDSEYSIKCLNEWVVKWLSDPIKYKMKEKMNLDLILRGKEVLDKLRFHCEVRFRHVNSHTKEPHDKTSMEWFMWNCNDMVDRMCTRVLTE